MRVERDGWSGFTLIPETAADRSAISRWSKNGALVAVKATCKETDETVLSVGHVKNSLPSTNGNLPWSFGFIGTSED